MFGDFVEGMLETQAQLIIKTAQAYIFMLNIKLLREAIAIKGCKNQCRHNKS